MSDALQEEFTKELARHQWYDASSDHEDPAIGCTGCPEWFGSEDALDDGTFAAHQYYEILPLLADIWEAGMATAKLQALGVRIQGVRNPYIQGEPQ